MEHQAKSRETVLSSDLSMIPVSSSIEPLKKILDSIEAIIYVADFKTYEVIFANRYLRETFEIKPGQTCWQCIQNSPSGPCGFCPNDKLLDKEGNPTRGYRWEQLNTVDKRWYDTIDRAIYWTDGRPVRLTIATDITERKKIEESLQETNEKLNTLLKNSPDVIQVVDSNFNVIYSNELIKESAPQLVLGKSVFDTILPVYHEGFKEKFRKVVETQKTVSFEYQGVKGRWWETEIAPITVGMETDCTMTINRDITRRKQVAESLIETNQKLNTVLKNSPDTILVIDRNFTILYSNEVMKDGSESMVRSRNALDEIDSKYHRQFKQMLEEVLDNKNANSFEFEDSKGNWWESRVAQITINLDSGCAMLINRNISDRKIVEHYMKEAQRELELRIKERTAELEQTYQQLIQRDKMATLGFLASSIAHEINNPNSFISFNIPILKDYITDILPILDEYAKQHKEYEICGLSYHEFRGDIQNLLENMKHGSQRINDTVANLKEFVGTQQEKEFKRVELKSVVERGVELCRNKINSLVTSFSIDMSDAAIIVNTIPQSVEQILINLLINAAQSADKPDSWVKLVVFQEKCRQGAICFEIRDNGCGILPENLPRIFDPFFTTKKKQSGLGLGLNITKKLVEEIGGTIEVESKPKIGSCFRLIIPIQKNQQ
jgi:PAS domain S-box-containing protein